MGGGWPDSAGRGGGRGRPAAQAGGRQQDGVGGAGGERGGGWRRCRLQVHRRRNVTALNGPSGPAHAPEGSNDASYAGDGCGADGASGACEGACVGGRSGRGVDSGRGGGFYLVGIWTRSHSSGSGSSRCRRPAGGPSADVGAGRSASSCGFRTVVGGDAGGGWTTAYSLRSGRRRRSCRPPRFRPSSHSEGPCGASSSGCRPDVGGGGGSGTFA